MSEEEYDLLEGEDERKIVLKIQRRYKCHNCNDEYVDYRVTYLLPHARTNPASSGYHRDDCSWCSDSELLVCKRCLQEAEQHPPAGYEYCGTFDLKRFPHMGLYWHEEELDMPELITGRSAEQFKKKLGI